MNKFEEFNQKHSITSPFYLTREHPHYWDMKAISLHECAKCCTDIQETYEGRCIAFVVDESTNIIADHLGKGKHKVDVGRYVCLRCYPQPCRDDTLLEIGYYLKRWKFGKEYIYESICRNSVIEIRLLKDNADVYNAHFISYAKETMEARQLSFENLKVVMKQIGQLQREKRIFEYHKRIDALDDYYEVYGVMDDSI